MGDVPGSAVYPICESFTPRISYYILYHHMLILHVLYWITIFARALPHVRKSVDMHVGDHPARVYVCTCVYVYAHVCRSFLSFMLFSLQQT